MVTMARVLLALSIFFTLPGTSFADNYWKEPGANPFGPERDAIKAIKMLSAPEEVKAEWIERVKDEKFVITEIKVGHYFEEMFFGDYKVMRKVHAAWKNKEKTERAKLYSVEFEGRVYALVMPFVCHNWAWTSMIKSDHVHKDLVNTVVVYARNNDYNNPDLHVLGDGDARMYCSDSLFSVEELSELVRVSERNVLIDASKFEECFGSNSFLDLIKSEHVGNFYEVTFSQKVDVVKVSQSRSGWIKNEFSVGDAREIVNPVGSFPGKEGYVHVGHCDDNCNYHNEYFPELSGRTFGKVIAETENETPPQKLVDYKGIVRIATYKLP